MKHLSVALFLVMLAGAAQAQETPWSAGLSVASAQEHLDDDGFSFDDGSAIGLRVGYLLSPAVTLEGELEYVDGIDGDLTVGATRIEADVEAVVLAGKVKYFPLSETWSGSSRPYLMAGIGVSRSELDVEFVGIGSTTKRDTDFVWMLGLGMDFWATERWAIGAEAAYKDVDGGEGYATFGLNVRRRF